MIWINLIGLMLIAIPSCYSRPGTYCSLTYAGKCYRVIGRVSGSIKFNHFDAESECRSLGGKLAPIVSREHYNRVYNYVRTLYSGTVWVWLGMWYHNNRVEFEDGTRAPYVRWHNGFPKSGARPKMGMRIETGPHQHMFNDPGHYTLPNALCEFPLY